MPIPFEDDLEEEDKPDFACLKAGRVSKPSVFKIYPISQLGSLIESLRVQIPPKHTVLFLVDDSGKIWFAGDEVPSPDVETEFRIPMYYQMTGRPAINARCMTAGTLEFSADYQHIDTMGNRSCTFKPTFDSLKWALAILIANRAGLEEQSIRFKAELTLEQYSTGVGGFQGDYHQLNTDEFTAWAQEKFAREEAYFLQQPIDIKTVTYKPSTAATPNHFLAPPAKRVCNGGNVVADSALKSM